MNNPFDYKPDEDCQKAYNILLSRIELLKKSSIPGDKKFCRELEEGKMLGVLIAKDSYGNKHTLYAFSGQIGTDGFHFPDFVEPVFDYLQVNGYYKIKESEIIEISHQIKDFEENTLSRIKNEYNSTELTGKSEISDFKKRLHISKLERDAKRESGKLNDFELSSLIRQSQFEKAELGRLKKRVAENLAPLAAKLQKAEEQLNTLIDKRRTKSELLQKWLFSNFAFLNAKGEKRNLYDIFAETPFKTPPSGAGECCAPKLLQTAYKKGLTPISMAEFWYGKPKGGEVRIHGQHYPACRGKCLPILKWMLQGLSINTPLLDTVPPRKTFFPKVIHENQWFCVVIKPDGMLSVPGKGDSFSLLEWLNEKYGPQKKVKLAHRLDQDTSGLIIATFGDTSYKIMQSLFASRKVNKTYIAILDGDYKSLNLPSEGRIELSLTPDLLDRPRQRIDNERGKSAVTDFKFLKSHNGRSRVIFHPLTGRTHQLRVHAAAKEGLGIPIVGDRLYGKRNNPGQSRLLLHAQKIEFMFPIDGKIYSFESPAPF